MAATLGLGKWQRRRTTGGSERWASAFPPLKCVVSQKQYVVFSQVELVYKLKKIPLHNGIVGTVTGWQKYF